MSLFISGVAGFIGSTTAHLALDQGLSVVGVDSLTDYYDRSTKKANVASLTARPGFSFLETDVRSTIAGEAIKGCDAVIHLSAQPGVRRSWTEFDSYVESNIHATKAVLDATLRGHVPRVVYASSSSVYGEAPSYPTSEDTPTNPVSPYALTKLAAEQLCTMYASEHGLSTVSLRYFTVYGPRQRPDMLTHRLIDATETGLPLSIFGNGEQTRDFTYVGDIARANILAATSDIAAGEVLNIAGGQTASVNEVIETVEQLTGRRVPRTEAPNAMGDVARTSADCSKAEHLLGWVPEVSLTDGIAEQIAHQMRPAGVPSLP